MKEGKCILDELLEYTGLKVPTLAKNVGVLSRRLYDISTGKSKKISLDLANKICAAYPEINKAYLLKGEGELLNNAGRSINVSHSPNANVAGNDINISNEQMAKSAIELDDTITKADLFAVIRHLQEANDRHVARIEKLTMANERLNAVLLDLVAKCSSGEITTTSLKSVLSKFEDFS